jgi:hypothetical protein
MHDELTPEDRAMCAFMRISPEEFLASKRQLAAEGRLIPTPAPRAPAVLDREAAERVERAMAEARRKKEEADEEETRARLPWATGARPPRGRRRPSAHG